jgi:hypothetical protein
MNFRLTTLGSEASALFLIRQRAGTARSRAIRRSHGTAGVHWLLCLLSGWSGYVHAVEDGGEALPGAAQ